MCFYDGAPEYRIVPKAPDFKTAEDLWQKFPIQLLPRWKKMVDKQPLLELTELIINNNYAIHMAAVTTAMYPVQGLDIS